MYNTLVFYDLSISIISHTVAFYRASNNEIEASLIEKSLDEDSMLFVLSLAA